MSGTEADRSGRLLARGRALLRSGRNREAGLAFGRVLLRHAEHAEARQGLAKARQASAESTRELEQKLDEAERALGAGRRDRARSLIEDAQRRGGDHERASSLLERLAPRSGRVEFPGPAEPEPEPAGMPARREPAGLRRALMLGWAILFATLAAGLGFSWDRLVEQLVRPPVPAWVAR
jgi:hypothetical protein